MFSFNLKNPYDCLALTLFIEAVIFDQLTRPVSIFLHSTRNCIKLIYTNSFVASCYELRHVTSLREISTTLLWICRVLSPQKAVKCSDFPTWFSVVWKEAIVSCFSYYQAARFAVLTALKIEFAVFWVVAPCSVIFGYKRFGRLCCLHLQG
jgi:hypothetical protein